MPHERGSGTEYVLGVSPGIGFYSAVVSLCVTTGQSLPENLGQEGLQLLIPFCLPAGSSHFCYVVVCLLNVIDFLGSQLLLLHSLSIKIIAFYNKCCYHLNLHNETVAKALCHARVQVIQNI